MDLQPQDWLERVVHGVRSLTPTLVELAEPDHRWLALDAILNAVSVVWLIVPDHEREEALRELTARLPDVPVSHPSDPLSGRGLVLVAESWFFEHVSEQWLTQVTEPLPNAMVVLKGDGFVERARKALTRSVRDRRITAQIARRVRVGRLVGCTTLVADDVVRELGRPHIPIVDDHPNWVTFLEQELGGVALKSRPVEVGPVLRHTFTEQPVVLLGQALAVGGSMLLTADELGLDDVLEVFDDPMAWDDLTLFTPVMPETRSAAWPYAVADAAWQAIRAREGRALVFGSKLNRPAIQRKIRRPLRVLGERGAGVVFAGPRELDHLGSFPLVVIDRLPFPSSLEPEHAVQRLRRLRWYEEVALPKAVQRFRRIARLVEPGGTLVVLDHRIWTRTYGELFTDAVSGVHITDWEAFLPTDSFGRVGGVA
jgi:hypothetical protein